MASELNGWPTCVVKFTFSKVPRRVTDLMTGGADSAETNVEKMKAKATVLRIGAWDVQLDYRALYSDSRIDINMRERYSSPHFLHSRSMPSWENPADR